MDFNDSKCKDDPKTIVSNDWLEKVVYNPESITEKDRR